MVRDRAAGHFLAQTWHMVPVAWRGRCTVAIGLAVLVVSGWLLVAGAVALTLPDAPSTPTTGFVAVIGRTARIHQPGIQGWPIPVDRHAYDEYYVRSQDSDDNDVFTAFEWIKVEHHQAVRVIEVDGEAHHVELLEGQNVGRSGWVKTRHLGP